MTAHFDSCENAAKNIIANVGKSIVIAVPLGIGKPIGLLNALFKIALNDALINLTIITALTLARPQFKSDLEKRFAEPILARLLQDYVDPLYEQYRVSQSLPNNIKVIEFFLMPAKFLHNDYVQQNYINSSYTNVNRDVMNLSVNVLAQQVSPSSTHKNLYSVSCNSDLFNDLQKMMKQSASSTHKIAIVAEVNANLPFMYGEEAEIDESIFTDVIDTQRYHALFALPRDPLSTQDHLIGLYTSALIKDGGTLQIGIGQLSNALANALIYRHQKNASYQDLLKQLKFNEKFGACLSKSGSLATFEKGLYASTEMLSDAYIYLYKENILKKRVYDHVGLQKLLNEGLISEFITPETINVLIKHGVINATFTQEDEHFMQRFGILKQDKSLGDKLISGKILHAGFFLGSVDLYATLKQLPINELQLFEMTSIARTNALSWSPELLTLQRQNARFVNDCLMVTALGVIIADGLNNYQELSGVGGQYDFVSMANQLPNAHSIINCHSTHQSKQGVNSNIIWDYTNFTIPRFLRDYVVTEYGIADCRSKTDADIIKAMLNITDSRFQPTLLNQAKKAGKLPHDYQIPELFTNNYPEVLEAIIKPFQQQGYFKPYPFGSDLTADEQTLAHVLLKLKNESRFKLFKLIITSLFFFKNDSHFAPYLERLQLQSVKNVKEYFYKKLIKYLLYQHECRNYS